ncbi:hypothetical protein D9Q98_002409 [Chlorella vulgaris]|uniref:CCR4-NOT transcription complex subunit 11 n=1 Tax=Chlorella vulgaris TaxID=3077 RepID=A0A9D4TWK9_CHLVU|nr:hypothetical protein D9Q98_002409 [Chlorella vulgaris]
MEQLHTTSDLLRLLEVQGRPYGEVAAAVARRFGADAESQAWLARTLITLLRDGLLYSETEKMNAAFLLRFAATEVPGAREALLHLSLPESGEPAGIQEWAASLAALQPEPTPQLPAVGPQQQQQQPLQHNSDQGHFEAPELHAVQHTTATGGASPLMLCASANQPFSWDGQQAGAGTAASWGTYGLLGLHQSTGSPDWPASQSGSLQSSQQAWPQPSFQPLSPPPVTSPVQQQQQQAQHHFQPREHELGEWQRRDEEQRQEQQLQQQQQWQQQQQQQQELEEEQPQQHRQQHAQQRQLQQQQQQQELEEEQKQQQRQQHAQQKRLQEVDDTRRQQEQLQRKNGEQQRQEELQRGMQEQHAQQQQQQQQQVFDATALLYRAAQAPLVPLLQQQLTHTLQGPLAGAVMAPLAAALDGGGDGGGGDDGSTLQLKHIAGLTEHNSAVAAELLVTLAMHSPEAAAVFAAAVAELPMTAQSVECLMAVATRAQLPDWVLTTFLANCMQETNASQDAGRQSRQVKLLCACVAVLLQRQPSALAESLPELLSFCIQQSRHKQASQLYRQLRDVEHSLG